MDQLLRPLKKESSKLGTIRGARVVVAATSAFRSVHRLSLQRQQLKKDPIAIQNYYDCLAHKYSNISLICTQFADESIVTNGVFKAIKTDLFNQTQITTVKQQYHQKTVQQQTNKLNGQSKQLFQNNFIYCTAGSSGKGKIWAVKQHYKLSKLYDEGQQYNQTVKIEDKMQQNTYQNYTPIHTQEVNCKLMSDLPTPNKMCSISIHPRIFQIPRHGPNFISGSATGEINLWPFIERISQQKPVSLLHHQDRVNNTLFDIAGFYLFSSSYDTTWAMHDLTKLVPILTQRGHNDQIHATCLHPDGALLFTGDLEGSGAVWDIRTGKIIYSVGLSHSMLSSGFSPNGYELAIGGKSNQIHIFDLRYKKSLHTIPAHTKLISGLVYADDSSAIISCSHDQTIKMFHPRTYSKIGSWVHCSKLTSVDSVSGMIAATTIDRKWSLFSANGY